MAYVILVSLIAVLTVLGCIALVAMSVMLLPRKVWTVTIPVAVVIGVVVALAVDWRLGIGALLLSMGVAIRVRQVTWLMQRSR